MNQPVTTEPRIRRWSLFPKALSAEVERLVKPVCKQQGFSEHRLLTEWQSVVGADLARYSAPRKLTFPKGRREMGALHVGVFPGRALELQHMQPQILERIATYFGYRAVERLVFMQDAQLRPVAKPKHRRADLPPDERVMQQVAQCADDALRHALASLGQAISTKNFP